MSRRKSANVKILLTERHIGFMDTLAFCFLTIANILEGGGVGGAWLTITFLVPILSGYLKGPSRVVTLML